MFSSKITIITLLYHSMKGLIWISKWDKTLKVWDYYEHNATRTWWIDSNSETPAPLAFHTIVQKDTTNTVLYVDGQGRGKWKCDWKLDNGCQGVEMSSYPSFCLSLCRKVEQRFHMCDRMAIYFFIAASYSPWWVTRSQSMNYMQFGG